MQESALGQECDRVEIARCLLAQLPDALWSQAMTLPGLASVSSLSSGERFFCAVGKWSVRKLLPCDASHCENRMRKFSSGLHFFPIIRKVRVTVRGRPSPPLEASRSSRGDVRGAAGRTRDCIVQAFDQYLAGPLELRDSMTKS